MQVIDYTTKKLTDIGLLRPAKNSAATNETPGVDAKLEDLDVSAHAKWPEFKADLLARICSACGAHTKHTNTHTHNHTNTHTHTGSKKVTTYSRGKPAEYWADFHCAATEAAGWKTHHFGSCIEEPAARSKCLDCGKTDVLAAKC